MDSNFHIQKHFKNINENIREYVYKLGVWQYFKHFINKSQNSEPQEKISISDHIKMWTSHVERNHMYSYGQKTVRNFSKIFNGCMVYSYCF